MPKIILNPEQNQAVKHLSGPLIVVAGAGTGKTRIITERIKYLMQEKNVDPDSILALTFTDKAANEMVERLQDAMPLGYKEPWVLTFHAFADRILRQDGLEIGLDINYDIISYPHQWVLVRKNLFEFNLDYYRPLGNPSSFISKMLSFVSRLQDEVVDEKNFEDFVKSLDPDSMQHEDLKKLFELSSFYTKYQYLKVQNSYLDFGDLVLFCLRLFDLRPNILNKYQNQFLHIMVDEFQDTNVAQYELVKRLFPPRKHLGERSLIVVGDDSQSIYKFRGAAISNILNFMEDYKESKMITIIKNYRSSQSILDAAYNVIQKNNPYTLESKLGISKKLVAAGKRIKSPEPSIYSFENYQDEVNFVVSEIQRILSSYHDVYYKDIAILSRANSHLDNFVVALRAKNIPYQLIGNKGLYDTNEVKDVISLIRVIVNPLDGVSLYRVLSNVFDYFPSDEASYLFFESKNSRINLWDLLKKSNKESAKRLVSFLESYQSKIFSSSASSLVFSLVSESGILRKYSLNENVDSALALRNLDLFLNQIKNFERDYYKRNKKLPNLIEFVDYLDLMIEAGDNPAQAEIEDIDTVILSTVHSAKGLEFEAVFMVNLVNGRFPSREMSDSIPVPDQLIKETLPTGDVHIQEERRLFYVGLTRARRFLYLTYAKNYTGRKEFKPSIFLEETKLKVIDNPNIYDNIEQASFFNANLNYREKTIEDLPKRLPLTGTLSYSTCPLQFKYDKVLNIPKKPSSALSFGNTIHEVLKHFHINLMFGKKISFEELVKVYNEKWEDAGYIDNKHRHESFNYGIKILRDYYDKEINKNVNIMYVEKSLSLKIDEFLITMRIDRIDDLGDGLVEVIDYKTGRKKDDKNSSKEPQILLYGFAVQEVLKLKPSKFTIYYIESNESTVYEAKEDVIKREFIKLSDIIKGIKERNFHPEPGKHCLWCDYRDICPFAYKER